MSDKYIIKNCPAYYEGDCISPIEHIPHATACQHIEDCVFKQIVQVCNEYSDKWEDCDFSNGLSDEIFKLLDIQGVE